MGETRTIQKYKATHPGVEVSGQSMLSVIAGIQDDAQQLLAKYELTDIDPETWYPQQMYVDMFKEMEDGWGNYFNLVSIGMQIPAHAPFPPAINSVETALGALHMAYHMNNRHEVPERGWSVEKIDEHTFRAVSNSPYPVDFEYGIVYGMVQRFRPEGWGFKVEIAEQTPEHAVYLVSLRESH